MQSCARPVCGPAIARHPPLERRPVARGRQGVVLLLLLATLLLDAGCLVRRIRIVRKGAPPAARLLTVSLEDLVDRLKSWDQQIRTINATVDMEPSLGTVNKGDIEELKDVRAFVLIRKPNWFRMIGLYPIVRNRAFDMVSDGIQFRIYFPVRNKFVMGRNRVEKPSPKKLENIRPQHIFDALVVRPPGPDEIPVLENHTDEAEAAYILHILRYAGGRAGEGRLLLDRNLWFDRATLRLARQVIFDARGDIVTDARYEDYHTDKNGLTFPRQFTIARPIDEYGVKLTVKKLDLNAPLEDAKFELKPPPGVEVIQLSTDGDANHP